MILMRVYSHNLDSNEIFQSRVVSIKLRVIQLEWDQGSRRQVFQGLGEQKHLLSRVLVSHLSSLKYAKVWIKLFKTRKAIELDQYSAIIIESNRN